MGLIMVKMKVFLVHEEDMEQMDKFEGMGTKAPGKWVWRDVSIHTDDIRRLITYNSKKTLIEDYNGSVSLVMESFEDVYKKWDDNKDENVEFDADFEDEQELEQEE